MGLDHTDKISETIPKASLSFYTNQKILWRLLIFPLQRSLVNEINFFRFLQNFINFKNQRKNFKASFSFFILNPFPVIPKFSSFLFYENFWEYYEIQTNLDLKQKKEKNLKDHPCTGLNKFNETNKQIWMIIRFLIPIHSNTKLSGQILFQKNYLLRGNWDKDPLLISKNLLLAKISN